MNIIPLHYDILIEWIEIDKIVFSYKKKRT